MRIALITTLLLLFSGVSHADTLSKLKQDLKFYENAASSDKATIDRNKKQIKMINKNRNQQIARVKKTVSVKALKGLRHSAREAKKKAAREKIKRIEANAVQRKKNPAKQIKKAEDSWRKNRSKGRDLKYNIAKLESTQ